MHGRCRPLGRPLGRPFGRPFGHVTAQPVYGMRWPEAKTLAPEGGGRLPDVHLLSEERILRLSVLSLAGGLVLAAGPALADAGVPPVWSDFQPAVSTQYRPPDGGRAYLPPNTQELIRPEDRRAAERAEAELNRKAAQPIAPPRDSAAAPKVPRRMKDPLALPPLPPGGPAMPAAPPGVETNPAGR